MKRILHYAKPILNRFPLQKTLLQKSRIKFRNSCNLLYPALCACFIMMKMGMK